MLWAISIVFLAALAAWHAFLLPQGALKYIDEFWTLDRAGSFAAQGDWLTVRSENLPNFNKPPLQYWVSAWLLERGQDLEAALRLPSFVFALLLLPVAGIIAFQLCGNPVAIPAAMLLLASSFRYWESALSALLDMGATFFATASLAAFFAATRNPRWWYAAAVLAGVGSLQKAPIALGFLAIAAIVFMIPSARTGEGGAKRVFANRHFAIAAAILVALHLAWPLAQYLKFGQAYLQQAYVDQMWERFAGGDDGGPGGSAWFKGLFRGQPLLEAPLIAAVLAVPLIFRGSRALTLTLLFITYVVLSGIAGEQGSVRYAIMFYPVMAASAAAIAIRYLGNNALLWLALFSLVLGTPFKSAETLRLDQSTQSRHVEFMQRVAGAAQPEEAFIRCRWNRGKNPIFPGALSYYASAGRPVVNLRSAGDIAQLAGPGPYRGICTAAEFADLQKILPGAVIVETSGNNVHWTAPAQ